jgi:hypothetical protein
MRTRIAHRFIIPAAVILALNTFASPSATYAAQTAKKFGMHEITLTGNGSASNPFDTKATVTFTPVSGKSNAVTVDAFYDGGNTWRARLYITQTGAWNWSSQSVNDTGLNGKTGTFEAVNSQLRGKLRKAPSTARHNALVTDNGKWFLNVADTPYYLFRTGNNKWQAFVKQSWEHGISLMRCSMLGDLRSWSTFWDNGNKDKLNLTNLQKDDTRIQWILENYPDMYIQLIVLPEPQYKKDESVWAGLSRKRKDRVLKNVVARYAAYPQIIWLLGNDYAYSGGHSNNVAMMNEWGNYLKKNDPWSNLRATGRTRGAEYYPEFKRWSSYMHIETSDALYADQIKSYSNDNMHLYNGEDRYEKYKAPSKPAIYFRRMIWSWTLSGGSATYAGVWNKIIPYNEGGFTGLDNTIHIRAFFESHKLGLLKYFQDDGSVTSSATGKRRPQVMRTEEKKSFLVYHPNASADGGRANVGSGTASFTIKDLPSETYKTTWMRADDGKFDTTSFTHSGGDKQFSAPWAGIDVVFYLRVP